MNNPSKLDNAAFKAYAINRRYYAACSTCREAEAALAIAEIALEKARIRLIATAKEYQKIIKEYQKIIKEYQKRQ